MHLGPNQINIVGHCDTCENLMRNHLESEPMKPNFFALYGVRHTESWDAVHKFSDERMKVWSVKQSQSVLPTLLPWIERSLDSLAYMRTEQEEGTILWINLPNCGVVGSMKREYFLGLITSLMTARPNNSVCIGLHANRASDSKSRKICA